MHCIEQTKIGIRLAHALGNVRIIFFVWAYNALLLLMMMNNIEFLCGTARLLKS